MKLKFATIICVASLLIGVADSRALTFEGTISGTITSADNASFYSFHYNSPLAVGDIITGHYSYESPTVDTPFSHPRITIQIGTGTLHFSQAWEFVVRGGQIERYFESFTDQPPPGYPIDAFHVSVSSGGINILEVFGSYEQQQYFRSAVGSLRFSDPVPQSVPDTTVTAPLFAFALGVLCFFRKQFNDRASISPHFA